MTQVGQKKKKKKKNRRESAGSNTRVLENCDESGDYHKPATEKLVM